MAYIKGGVGKTLVATSIAAVLAQRGRDVLLIDADDQASATNFAQIRAEVPGAAAFATVQLYGAAIRQQMKQLRKKYADIVIDVGGRDTGSLRAALMVADKVVVPFLPCNVDLWAGTKIAELVAEARDVNEGLSAYSFLNMADTQGHDNTDAFEALKRMAPIEPLPLAIGRHKAFPNAFSNGLCVAEQAPPNAKAVEELLSLVNLCIYAERTISIKMPPPPRPALAKFGEDEPADAFIGADGSPRSLAAPEPAMTKTVVNSRWDVELLRQIDQAAKRQGISRTAWLHVAAAEKLGKP